MVEKDGVPGNTWAKMGEKQRKVVSFADVEKKVRNSKRKKLRSGNFKKVDKAVHTWFISKRNQANKYSWISSGIFKSLRRDWLQSIRLLAK